MNKYRYSKQISTGIMIECQGPAHEDVPELLQTLKQNAIGQDIPEADIELGYCTVDEKKMMVIEKHPELAETYADRRKESYPPMENYLDGIVKGDQAQIDKYISDCLAIKEKFPKE